MSENKKSLLKTPKKMVEEAKKIRNKNVAAQTRQEIPLKIPVREAAEFFESIDKESLQIELSIKEK